MQTFSIGTVAFTYIGKVLDGRFPSSVASVHLALIIHKLELRNRERMVKPYDVKSFYITPWENLNRKDEISPLRSSC